MRRSLVDDVVKRGMQMGKDDTKEEEEEEEGEEEEME